ncbi:unnamed protein product [Acanthoscelides obtectus]|uniref:K Homology domain-containing protein n=1 Tax=Acanthoscelides obtectus TaxID=200917 RepID=A0A9P0PQ88_ACAOB|nr:unnamed protein product [Acanthoscelides obtectus]CAK1661239.1 Heterogeneous nuclear ribonucleoprotein K [Acanthoscelides obtectus]
MKREADGDMGSPFKRSRRGDEEVRLLIPSKVAGSIIGKGGQNITKLRSQYKASITVPDCPGPERLLSLSSDMDSVCNIIDDVVPNLEDGNSNGGKELDLRMLIHQSQAGCVIGKSGAQIKEIRDKTGAKVKIFSNTAPQSTDRIIQIVGEASKCIDAIREILTLIKSCPIKGPVEPYDPQNYDEFYADEYGGWGSSGIGGRENSRNGPMAGGPRGGGGGRRDSGGLGGRGLGGSRFDNNLRRGNDAGAFRNSPGSRPAPFLANAGLGGSGGLGGRGFGRDDAFGGGGSLGRMPAGGGGRLGRDAPKGGYERNGSFGGSQFNSRPSPSSISAGPLGVGSKTTTQVTIPKDMAGAIIGKGGTRIRKIRLDSGANITIDEPLPGSNDRIITISGSPNQIQMAQYLLQQSVHNAER